MKELFGWFTIKKTLILLFSCIVSLLPLAAAGKQDADFRQIDTLIEQRNYNEALIRLNEYIRQHPENFDGAQKRISRIMDARSLYSELADRLIDVLLDEPANDEKKLQMIAELESMEKNPTTANTNFIKETKVAAQFTFFRAKYAERMENGARFVDENRFVPAVNEFYAGLELYREDFFEQDYPDSITQPIVQALADIDGAVLEYENMQTRLNEAYQAFADALSAGNLAYARERFALFSSVMAEFASVRNVLFQSGQLFKNTFARMSSEYPDLTEASFPAFAYRFTLGRSGDTRSGLVGVLDTHCSRLMAELENAAAAQVRSFSVSADTQLASDSLFAYPAQHGDARSSFDSASGFAELGVALHGLYGLFETADGLSSPAMDAVFPDRMRRTAEVASDGTECLDTVRQLVQTARSVDETAETIDPAAALRSDSRLFQNALLAFIDAAGTAGERVAEIARRAAQYAEAEETTVALLQRLVSESALYADSLKSSMWLKLARFYAAGADGIAADYESQYAGAEALLQGTSDANGYVYPAESAEAGRQLLAQLPQDRARVAAVAPELVAAPAAAAEESLSRIDSSLAALDRIAADTAALITAAQERAVLAARAQNEADLRYNQAVQAMNAANFDTARTNLQRARAKYSESLSYQESSFLRERSDRILSELDASINRAENEVVVREVRSLKTQAKTAYYNGNFETAESLLIRARTRWSTTNVEEDLEITNLLSLVGTALSMKTGRVIPPTAPLYPEMSQILNIANQYYVQGKQLIADGKRSDAELILNQAKTKLRELQLVYPLNQEASLLTLRIDQLVNPSDFASLFENKIAAAKNDYKDPDKRQSAYTDLVDLYEINPSYPGLKQLLYDVEIEIGIRRKPVDTTALSRSASLTKEVSALVDAAGRDELKLRQALVKIDEAIGLNPENTDAMLLKDRIQTTIGGQSVYVLSAADEALYQQSVQELQKGNTIEAMALIEQLLKNPVNKRSFKILELQKRIESLL
ncbi:hypothetical protein Trebr_1739 [Treponema brennaborense DSM 12168]|uniref:Uncharacterized protein n=1 Tax=Treponema brennaborense (strain DSM 12168 / CIP 105900 / DD5/3) TaxID=906968 RepID=F4LQF2_TREBD|nr:hypothetical protein Trebr_1739 [Treponema brennaborense DSM 12168]